MKRFLFLLILILLPSFVQAATYYVAITGLDTNNCTAAQNIATPKRNIMGTSGGLACLVAGDILDIRSGTYSEQLNNNSQSWPFGTSYSNAPIIRAHDGETVTVRGIALGTSAAQYFIFGSLLGTLNVDGTGVGGADIIFVGNGANHIRFINVNGGPNPTGNIVQIDPNGSFVEWQGGSAHNATTGSYGFYVSGKNNTIEHAKIYSNGGFGVHNYSAYGPGLLPDNNIWRYNVIYSNCTDGVTSNAGLLLGSGTNNQAYANVIYNNNCYGLRVGSNTTTNSLVDNNTVTGNTSSGIEFHNQSGSIFKNNILYANGGGFENPFGESVTYGTNLCGSSGTGCAIVGDPQFVNASAANFALLASSPAINRGTDVSGDIGCTSGSTCVDFNGAIRPQGTSWDVGAFEFQAVYWVSTTGNNANSCASILSPTDPGVYKRDITGANGGLSCLSAGATLKIKGGTYSEYLRYDLAGLTLPNGTSDTARITIQRSAADQAVILRSPRTFPSNVMPIDFLGQSYWTLDGITVDCENFITGGACVRISGSNINFINGEIKNASTTCFLGGSPGGLYANNKVHDCSAHGTTTPPEHGMYVAASNTTVEKNEVYNVEGWGIHVFDQNNAVSNVTVRANTVHDFAQGGVGGDGILLSRGTNNLAYNNVVYRGTGANGIRIGLCLAGCTGSALYNNTIYNVTQGIQLDTNVGVLVKNNIISSAGSPPISDTGTGTVFATNLCDIAATGCTNVGNPNFVSPTNDNFQLQASSVAVINRGTDLSSVFTTDILTVARPSGAWDIGAYEFASEVVPPTVPALVARYGFNEVSGSTVLDSSGKGNHGTFGAGVTRVTPGKYGKGLQFTNGTVTVPHSISLNLTDGMTIAAWIQPTVSDTGYHTLLSKTSNYFVFSPSGTSSCLPGGAYGGFAVGSVFSACSTSALTLNVWTHVALTYSVANNRLRFYVNGALTQETTVNVNMLTNTDNLLIGNSAVDETFTGYIDEMWIYNFEKTQAEVVTIMNTPVDVAVSPPSYALGPTGSKKIAPGAPIKTGRIIAP